MSTPRNPTSNVDRHRVTGAMFGLAIGDAWGDPVEFRRYPDIVSADERGPAFPEHPRITDDTQMSLAVWDALTEGLAADGSAERGPIYDLGQALGRAFYAWSVDAENTRAPGSTCMSACAALGRGREWWQSGVASRGCGTVMRAPWIGLHPHVRPEAIGAIAETQAYVTHTDPGACAAAHAAAVLTHQLATDQVTPDRAAAWLADYATFDGPENGLEYGRGGWLLVQQAAFDAERLASALERDPWGFDPCKVAGQGWDAVTCLAVAVGVLTGMDAWIDQPDARAGHDTIRRAAVTNGDSDSIAALTGAFAGAAYGTSATGRTVNVLALEDRYREAIEARVDQADGAPAPAPVFVAPPKPPRQRKPSRAALARRVRTATNPPNLAPVETLADGLSLF